MQAKNLVLGAVLAGVLAACGTNVPTANLPDEDAVAEALSVEEGLDSALLEDLGGATGLAVQSVADQEVQATANDWGLPRVVVRVLRDWGGHLPPRDASGTCVIDVSAPPVDDDGDGVVDAASASFDCSGTMTPEEHQVDQEIDFTVSGAIDFTDKTGDHTGFTLTLTDFVVSLSGTRNGHAVTRTRTVNGTVDLSGSADTGWTWTRDLDLSVVITVDGAVHSETTVASSKTKTYTPDDPNQPGAAGTVTVNGTTTITRNGETQELVVTSSTEPPLHWSRECAESLRQLFGTRHFGGFDAGWIRHENLTTGAFFQVTYNACGDVTIEKSL